MLLEWEETFGSPAPPWAARLVGQGEGDSHRELLRILAGASDALFLGGRDPDEVIIEVLAALPADGDFVHAFDSLAVALLRLVNDDQDSNDNGTAPLSLVREAIFRLLRVTNHIPERLPLTVAEVHRRVEAHSLFALPMSAAQDLAGEYLQVVALSQTDDRFIPTWWRLCDLDWPLPEHAVIGVLGLRWSSLGMRDLAPVVTEALARLALACARSADEELLSASRARRIFLTSVRITARARGDLDWGAIGSRVMAMTTSTPAAAWTASPQSWGKPCLNLWGTLPFVPAKSPVFTGPQSFAKPS